MMQGIEVNSRAVIDIEVVYALPEQQQLVKLQVVPGTTVEQAIMQANLTAAPDLSQHKVGIFSKLVDLSHIVQTGDRIEIYRQLTIDPKEKRRLRAKQQRSQV